MGGLLSKTENEENSSPAGALAGTGQVGAASGGKGKSARKSAKAKRGMKGGSSCMRMSGGMHKGKKHSHSRSHHRSRK